MNNRKCILGLGLALCLSLPFIATAEDSIEPKWQIGDRWTVETQTIQSASTLKSKKKTGVEWNFLVSQKEAISRQECFRVEITCADTSRPQPNVTIWVNCQTGMLMRLTSRIPVEGTYRSYTESYATSAGIATPVLGIIPSLPLDIPIFNEAAQNSKSLEPMVYLSSSGEGESKDINEISFAYPVTQNVSAVEQSNTKSLGVESDVSPTVKVEIAAGTKKVEQFWTSGKPWPVYSTNGVCVSRLKGFIPAGQKEEK